MNTELNLVDQVTKAQQIERQYRQDVLDKKLLGTKDTIKLYDTLDKFDASKMGMKSYPDISHKMRGLKLYFDDMTRSNYLINKSEGYSVDIGKEIHDMDGNKAEIDVLAVLGKHSIKVMECKAKNVKNLVTYQEIHKWIKVRIPQIKQWIESQERFHSTTNVSFEYWTTSGYTEEAIKLINDYKPKRFNVEFKNGKDVLKYATETKEQSITNALKEHFFSHPLAKL